MAWQFAGEHLLAQFVQASIVMIANISQRLVQLCGDFGECVALVEMQAQSITLVLGESIQKPLHGRVSDHILKGTVVLFPAR
jgi:hypothetical protein